MLWSSNSSVLAYLVGGLFRRKAHTHYKVDSFEHQNTIFLILIVHIIYITGIPGNILTLIVLQKKSLHDNFVSIFLSGMCVVNLWCLITGFSAYWWMAVNNGDDFRNNSPGACFYHWFVTLISLQVNEWLIVLVSACRILVITSRSRTQRHESCKCGILILGGMLAAIVIPGFLMINSSVSTNYVGGEIVDCDFVLSDDLKIIYFVMTHYLPPFIVVAENFVMYYLYRKSMSPIMRLRPANIAANQRMKMLIVMTDVMFFVTSVPPLLFHEISRSLFYPENKEAAATRKFELVLMFTILYGGFAYNIVIYCCFGRRFRTELKMLILKPMHHLGFCKTIKVKDTATARHTEHIPFSMYTSSGSNTPEVIAADGQESSDRQLDEDQLESLESSVRPTLWQGQRKSADVIELARALRNRQDVEEGFRLSCINLDRN